MGCVSSKEENAPVTPAFGSGGIWDAQKFSYVYENGAEDYEDYDDVLLSARRSNVSTRLGNLHNYIEGDQVAACWPSWLTDVAGELVQGWQPLRADSFQKLEKIGQGTYSSVYKAQEVETGRIVALKKVHLDYLDPESVKFMAREIHILRKLNHPNVIKLEGIITSQFSFSIYLVFEYMEHDLAGLLSCPNIRFSEPQIKCFMHQLLVGLEHCHSLGIMHRDIKSANLLVNKDGILKIADFGLANFLTRRRRKPLTARVVTLWYRPPELLLGSTNYDASIDLWSVGCVFAEMFLRKPILKGRTEVEQIHKIYKLCGSPPDDYWRKSRLPHATAFTSQQTYKNSLQENFGFLPETALDLLKTLLSVEAHKRKTATEALNSQYFRTRPYACPPSSMPKYPPSKEIDAKFIMEQHRSRIGVADAKRRLSRGCKVSEKPDVLTKATSYQEGTRTSRARTYSLKKIMPGISRSSRLLVDLQPVPTIGSSADDKSIKKISERDPFSSSLDVSSVTGFAWANKPKARQGPTVQCEPDETSKDKHIFILEGQENPFAGAPASDSKQPNLRITVKQAMVQQLKQLDMTDSMNSLGILPSTDLSKTMLRRDVKPLKQRSLGHQGQQEKVEIQRNVQFQSSMLNETPIKNGRQSRESVQSSQLKRGSKSKSRNTLHSGK